jgi:hypothetical protein
MVLKNDTVRLLVFFKDFDGNVIVPTDVKLTIYNKEETIIETITDGIINLSQGKYQYDYTDTTGSDFIFEFSGVFNSKPVLARQEINVKFN